MNRRGFFATLLAPFLDRFRPKPTMEELDAAYWDAWLGSSKPVVMFWLEPDGVYQFNGKGYRKISDTELEEIG